MMRKILIGLLLIAPVGFYPFLVGPAPLKPPTPPAYQLSKNEQLATQCFSAFPGQPFPGNLPWDALRKIGEDETAMMRDLAKSDPVKFLEKALAQYVKDVRGYRLMFHKQERVQGKLRDPEKILCNFKESPFSVHMDWKDGAGLALRSLYVEGERGGKLAARIGLAGIPGPIVHRAVDDPSAKATSRFPISEFGIYHGARRTLNSMKEAQARNKLHVRFEGIEAVEKAGGRLCYKFIRDPYDPPEDDGLVTLTLYVDQETLLQVGSVLYDGKKDLIAEYFFRDIEFNPTFDAKQFTEKAL